MSMRAKLGASGRASPRVPPSGGATLSDSNPLAVVNPGAETPGVSTDASRADHQHAHGDLLGGSLHALAIANGAAGFMSGADKNQVDKYGWGIINAETQALFNAMDDRPPVFLGQAMDGLVTWLKESGWWDEIGYLLVPTLHTEQASLLDWKDPTQSAVNLGATFTPFQGFLGDAVSQYLTTIAPTDVPGYSLNSAHQFVWTEDGTGTAWAVGVAAGIPRMAIAPDGGGVVVTRNNAAINDLPGAAAGRDGLFQTIRSGAAGYDVFFAGALVGAVVRASESIQVEVSTLLRNLAAFQDDRILVYGIGGAPTALSADLIAGLDAFYDAIGTVHT